MDARSNSLALPDSADGAARYRIATRTRLSIIAALLGIGLIGLLASLPFFASRTVLKDMFYILTLATLAQYWNLLAGYAGLVSIGQQAFVGFGAYLLFATSIFAGLDPVLSLILAAGCGAIAALGVAGIVFRLHGAYFAVGTWVVAEVFRLLFAQMKSLGGGTGTSLPGEITNGAASIRAIAELMGVRSAVARDMLAYWLAVVIAVGSLLLIYALLRSRQGLALAAIRDNVAAAGSIGIDPERTKLAVFCFAGAGASLTGALIFFQTARISPDAAFSVTDFTAFVLFVVVIGGIGTLEGPIVGAIILFLLRDQLAGFGSLYLMLLGALAIVTMLIAPQGLWGSLAARWDLHLLPVRRRLVTEGTKLH